MSKYYSFLVCHHSDKVDLYVNGIPIGVFTGEFQRHYRNMPDGSRLAIRFRDIVPPMPCESMVILKAQLHAIIDAIPDDL